MRFNSDSGFIFLFDIFSHRIMKKLFLISSLMLFLAACHQEQTPTLTIQGKVKGMTKGMLHLEKIIDTSYVLVDTFRVSQDGTFVFHDSLDSPEVYYISIREYPKDRITVFAEPGTVTMTTKLERFSSFAEIEGSENQKLLDEFNEVKNKFNNDNLSLIKEKILAEKANNQPQIDSIQEVMNILLKRRYLYTTNFAVKHADMDIAPYLALSELYLARTYLLDTIANAMDQRTRNSHYGKKFTTFLEDIKATEKKPEQ